MAAKKAGITRAIVLVMMKLESSGAKSQLTMPLESRTNSVSLSLSLSAQPPVEELLGPFLNPMSLDPH